MLTRNADIFNKFSTQVLYVLAIPLFFFVFLLVYVPFDSKEFLDAGRGMFPFDATMLASILIVFMVIARTALYFIWRGKSISFYAYAAWCIGEIVLVSFFMALYMYLIWGGTLPYFGVLGKCLQLSILTSIYPYLVITLLLLLKTFLLNSSKSASDGFSEDSSLIRFYDAGKRLKLAIAASSVVYIDAEENYVRIHYVEGDRMKEYVLRNSMKSIEDAVEKFGLVRSHRSYIVNPRHVKMLRKDKEGVIMADFDVLAEPTAVSKKYYDRLVSLLV